VQGYAEINRGLSCSVAFGVDPSRRGARLGRRGQGAAACGLGAGIERKDREHRVADELQDFAARILHRLRHRPEIFVQQSDQRVARQCFRQLGEAAQIAQLNDGVNRLADAARNRTIEHATTRLAADIGIEQRTRGASKRLDFEVHRQGRHHRLEHADVVFAKSLRVIGWQGNSLCAAVRKPCAEDDIVGDPGLPQIGKDRKQGAFVRVLRVAANRAAPPS